MALVTLQEAKTHCRIDNDALDVHMQLIIDAVSDAIMGWLKDDWRAYVQLEDSNGPVVDSNGDPVPSDVVRPRVKLAALVEVAVQYRYTDGKDAPAVPSHWGYGYVLSAGATSLLAADRKSTIQ